MKIANPEFWWTLLVLPSVLMLYLYGFGRKRALMQKFAQIDMMKKLTSGSSKGLVFLKSFLLMTFLLFLVLALVRPQWGTKSEYVKRKGLDILLLQDISLSMLAEDIKPNRLTRSQHEISDFLSKSIGDRIGLVAFAGEAQLQCPLTLDHSAVRIFLDEMDPGMLMPGTNISEAIRVGMKSFESNQGQYNVMVLLTDGEEHDQAVMEQVQKAVDQGVTIYTIGIGSTQGVPIPLKKGGGNLYKKDRRGNIVTTKLEQETLKEIAFKTGGKYYHAGPGDFELAKILAEIEKLEKREIEGEFMEQHVDRYQYPLGIAIVILLLESFISDKRRKKKMWRGRFV